MKVRLGRGSVEPSRVLDQLCPHGNCNLNPNSDPEPSPVSFHHTCHHTLSSVTPSTLEHVVVQRGTLLIGLRLRLGCPAGNPFNRAGIRSHIAALGGHLGSGLGSGLASGLGSGLASGLASGVAYRGTLGGQLSLSGGQWHHAREGSEPSQA